MPIAQYEYDYYTPHEQWLRKNIAQVPRTLPGGAAYEVDLTDVAIGIVPRSVPMGTASQRNTAVYLPFATNQLQLKMTNIALGEYVDEHPQELVPPAVTAGRYFVTYTLGLGSAADLNARGAAEKLVDFATLWHELGHATLERLKRGGEDHDHVVNNEDNCYVIELDILRHALTTDHLGDAGLEPALTGYLQGRVSQYKLGARTRTLIVSGLQALRATLLARGAPATATNEAFTTILAQLPR